LQGIEIAKWNDFNGKFILEKIKRREVDENLTSGENPTLGTYSVNLGYAIKHNKLHLNTYL
jgi:hypothetical protein